MQLNGFECYHFSPSFWPHSGHILGILMQWCSKVWGSSQEKKSFQCAFGTDFSFKCLIRMKSSSACQCHPPLVTFPLSSGRSSATSVSLLPSKKYWFRIKIKKMFILRRLLEVKMSYSSKYKCTSDRVPVKWLTYFSSVCGLGKSLNNKLGNFFNNNLDDILKRKSRKKKSLKNILENLLKIILMIFDRQNTQKKIWKTLLKALNNNFQLSKIIIQRFSKRFSKDSFL